MFKGDTEQILQAKITPEDKLASLFRYFLESAYTTINSYGKINYEMSAVITDKKRREKILEGVHDKQSLVYGVEIVIQLIEENIKNGHFKPLVSKESIYALILAFFDGVFKGLTLSKCYGLSAPHGVTYEETDLSEGLTSAVLVLLDVDHNQLKQRRNRKKHILPISLAFCLILAGSACGQPTVQASVVSNSLKSDWEESEINMQESFISEIRL